MVQVKDQHAILLTVLLHVSLAGSHNLIHHKMPSGIELCVCRDQSRLLPGTSYRLSVKKSCACLTGYDPKLRPGLHTDIVRAAWTKVVEFRPGCNVAGARETGCISQEIV